ncbi:MAG: replication-relaxation family protein [Psychrosphaera sp.]|nr:replication-relaxation family protein [Psychrosphaera sp.]
MSVKGVQITARDNQVFLTLQRFPLLTASDIHNECFDGTAFSAVGRRLKKLLDHGLLQRVSLLNESHFRYYITKTVRPFLENDKPIKHVNHNHLRHDAELYHTLFQLSQNMGNTLTIIPDFELKLFAKKDYRVTREYKGVIQAFHLSFLPDALLIYKGRSYFLEYDRSTIWGVNLFKKLSAYQEYFTTELPTFMDQISLRDLQVIFVCQSSSRCAALQAAVNRYTDINVFQFLTVAQWKQRLTDSELFVP